MVPTCLNTFCSLDTHDQISMVSHHFPICSLLFSMIVQYFPLFSHMFPTFFPMFFISSIPSGELT